MVSVPFFRGLLSFILLLFFSFSFSFSFSCTCTGFFLVIKKVSPVARDILTETPD
jgi:hypothetical protein